MNNKIFPTAVAVAIGVFLGVLIVGYQAKSGFFKELYNQQAEILKIQKNMDKKIGSGSSLGGDDMDIKKIQALEQRVVSLEGQMKLLMALIRGDEQAAPTRRQQGPPPEDFSKVYDLKTESSPIRGKKDAPVTIVAFEDIQCPFCSRFYPPILEVLKAYPNEVNFVVKHFPLSFHPMARPAAKAVFAAGEQGKYWEMLDALLEDNKNLSEAMFQETAKKLGLNVDQFLKDYKDKDQKWEEIITQDMSLAEQSNVQGTPTFFINGRKTIARDFNAYKNEIEKILKEKNN